MIIDYSILALVGILVGGLAVSMKWYLQYREKTQRQIIREEKEAAKPENQLDQIFEHIPEILKDRQSLYEKALLEGGKDSPLAKSLKQQIDILNMVGSIPEPILKLGKPLLMGGLKAIQRFIPS